jgi:hypothetical protein
MRTSSPRDDRHTYPSIAAAGRLAALVVMLAACTSSSGAATLKATPANFDAIVAKADSGDVITLAPGEYGPRELKDRHYSPSLVIDARGATIVGWTLKAVSGISFKGGLYRLAPGRVHPRTGALVYGHTLRFDDARDVEISEATFEGPGDPSISPPVFGEGGGLAFLDGEDLKLSSSHFKGFKSAVALGNVDGFELVGNTFTGMRSDGIQVGSSRHGLIEGNDCSGTHVRSDEHPDCVQLWSRPPAPPTSDIVIRKNRVRGDTQGIGMFNHVRAGVDDGGFDRITIEDNDIEVSYGQGIGLMAARDSIVRNNKIRSAPHAKYRASLNVDARVARCGNVVAPGAGKKGVTEKAC